MPISAQFTEILDLAPFLKGREIISQGICLDGSLAVLAAKADKELSSSRIDAQTTAKQTFVMSLLRFGDDPAGGSLGKTIVQEVELAPSTWSYPQVQVLPDNSILVAHSRCELKPDGPELNASIYASNGTELRQFCLGDGIQDLKVSPAGEIWVSYFDEGIFGNFGWPENVSGAAGINCFDTTGTKIWSFVAPEHLGTIHDCYAMSIVGEDVVACYYSDFPIVRIGRDKQIVGWDNQVDGARAIAVNGNKVVLYGGYEDERSRCIVQTLEADGKVSDLVQIALTMPDYFAGETVTGHDSDLHVVVDSRWYRLSNLL